MEQREIRSDNRLTWPEFSYWTYVRGLTWDRPPCHVFPAGETRLPEGAESLLGTRPVLEFAGGRITLRAVTEDEAAIAAIAFEVDPALIEALRPRDMLSIKRTLLGSLVFAAARSRSLLFAVGAVTTVIGGDSELHVACMGSCLAVASGRERAFVERHQAARVGNYEVWLEQSPFLDEGGSNDESVSVVQRGLVPPAAAIRSAELLARPHSGMTCWAWGG